MGALFGETRFAAFGIESVGGYHQQSLKIIMNFRKNGQLGFNTYFKNDECKIFN